MSWGCEAALSIKINGNNISESIAKKELLLYADELAVYDISLSTKVKKPLFFEEFYWYLSFTQKAKKIHSNFSIVTDSIINENYMGSPIEVLEILLFAQYLSTKKADDLIEVGVGDASVVWMDIDFKNGIASNVIVKKEEDIDEPIDAFNCTEQEMIDFFSVSIIKRLNKINPVNNIADKMKAVGGDYKSGELFSKQPLEVRSDKQTIIECAAIYARVLQYVPKQFLDDTEVIYAAFKHNPYDALDFASERFKNNKQFVSDVVKLDGNALRNASPELRADRELALMAVSNDGSALKFVSDNLKNDKEIVLAAVKNNAKNLYNVALSHASDTLKDDKDIVLVAVEINRNAFEYASPKLKEDKDVIEKAIISDPLVFKHISKQVKGYEKLAKKAVELNFRNYGELPKELRLDEAMTLAVLDKLIGDFKANIDRFMAIDIAKSLRYFKNKKLLSFLNWLIDELKDGKDHDEIYFFRAEVYQQKNEIENYLKDINKSISMAKEINKYYLKNHTEGWAYETFIETLQNYALYELENESKRSSLSLFDLEPTNSISEPLCLTGRFIYECKSDSLKAKLKIIKENQTKSEIITQLEKVEKSDWQSSQADRLQFPIVGMNPLLFQDREIKELALRICPNAEYFYLMQNGDESELLQFAIKTSFIYDLLPIHLKSNMDVIIPYVSQHFDDKYRLSLIPHEVLEKRENVIRLRLSPYMFELLPEKYRNDPEVVLYAAQSMTREYFKV